jgi:hypothetical protein
MLGAGSASAAPKRPKKDTAAPVVEHTPLTTHDGKGPVIISARITDDSAIFEPTLVVRAASGTPGAPGAPAIPGAAFMRVPLAKGEGDTFSAEIPAALLSADVEYLVEAFDENGNGPSRVGDESAPLKIVRDVPAPPVDPVKPPDTGTGNTGGVPEDGDNTGLIVAGVVVGAVVLVGAAAGIGFAVYALRPPQPDVVNINVSGPAPIAGAL